MPVLDAFKASWDHLPKSPKLPPSMLKLASRRAWLNLRPTFTYGDDRDKAQLAELRQKKKQIERDEAWALKEAKMKILAERKRAKKANASAKSKGFTKPTAAATSAKTPLKAAPNGAVRSTKSVPRVVSPQPSTSRRPTVDTRMASGSRPPLTSGKASGSRHSPIVQRAAHRGLAHGAPQQYSGRPVAGLAALRQAQPPKTMPTLPVTSKPVVYKQVVRSPTQPIVKTSSTKVPQVVRSQSYPIEMGPPRRR